MKTKFFKVGKRTLSVVLSLMMLASSVFVGSSETVADAASDTSAGYSAADVAAGDSTVDESLDNVLNDNVTQVSDAKSDEVSMNYDSSDKDVMESGTKSVKKVLQSSGSSSYTVKFINAESWSSVKIWAWYYNSSDEKINYFSGNWSGRPSMSFVSGNIYSYTFTLDDSVTKIGFIFTGVKDNRDKQTVDIEIDDIQNFDFTNLAWVYNQRYDSSKRKGVWIDTRDNCNWYLEGRPFGSTWLQWEFDYQMTRVSSTLYKYETNESVASLSSTTNGDRWIKFAKFGNTGSFSNKYGPSGNNVTLAQTDLSTENQKQYKVLGDGYTGDDSGHYSVKFNDPTYNTGTVTIWLDTSQSSPRMYYTVENAEEPEGQTYTIYYDNSARKLGDVRAYIWSGSGSSAIEYNGTYANTLPMTYDETTHLWYVSGIPSAATGVIFKTGGQTHTDDLVFQGGKVYKWNSTSTSDVTISNYEGYTVDNAYSVAGRLQMKKSGGSVTYTYTNESDSNQWEDTINNDFLFTHVSGTTTYKFETNCSVAELSKDLGTSSESRPQYFYILDNSDQNGTRYKTSVETVLNGNNAGTHVSLSKSNKSHLYFNDANFTSGKVVLWFDSSTKEFWYTVDGATKYEATINTPTGPEGVDLSGLTVTLNNNSGSTFEVYNGVSATVKVSGIPTGYTADVTVTKADSQSSSGGDGYSSTGISKKMSKKTLNASGDTAVAFTSVSRATNEYTFTMPTSNVEVSVAIRNLNTYTIETAEVDTNNIGTINSPTNNSTAQEGSNVSLSATVTNSALYNVTWSIQKKIPVCIVLVYFSKNPLFTDVLLR